MAQSKKQPINETREYQTLIENVNAQFNSQQIFIPMQQFLQQVTEVVLNSKDKRLKDMFLNPFSKVEAPKIKNPNDPKQQADLDKWSAVEDVRNKLQIVLNQSRYVRQEINEDAVKDLYSAINNAIQKSEAKQDLSAGGRVKIGMWRLAKSDVTKDLVAMKQMLETQYPNFIKAPSPTQR